MHPAHLRPMIRFRHCTDELLPTASQRLPGTRGIGRSNVDLMGSGGIWQNRSGERASPAGAAILQGEDNSKYRRYEVSDRRSGATPEEASTDSVATTIAACRRHAESGRAVRSSIPGARRSRRRRSRTTRSAPSCEAQGGVDYLNNKGAGAGTMYLPSHLVSLSLA